MNWALAIEKNQRALVRIVAQIVALVGFVAGEKLETLPRGIYFTARRLLRPTESAVRRLIVIAARGLVVKPSISKAFPKGLVIAAGAKERAPSFPLFDARKRFEFVKSENPFVVQVKTYSHNPFNPFNQNKARWAHEPAARDDTLSLTRRLAAVKSALENLPRQAIRMARWQAKRRSLTNAKFTAALRPGPPPGFRSKAKSEIDYILQETHDLAWDALREDSS